MIEVLGTIVVVPPRGLNTRLYLDANSLARHTHWAHGVMSVFALWLGLALIAGVFAVAGARVWQRGDRRSMLALVMSGIASVVVLGANQLIGTGIGELRPYTAHPHVLVLVQRTGDFAFPSDHAVVAGALAVGVLFASRQLGLVAGVLAVLVALARVYVGAHYPGDVVVGLLLGGCVSFMFARFGTWSLGPLVRRTPGSRTGNVLGRAPAGESVVSGSEAEAAPMP